MTCAIVDAYGAGRLLPAALRRHGSDCVHVRSEFPDTRLAYRPEDFTIDIAHHPDVVRTAAQLRRLGVEFVVAAAESGVLLADELSAALGTPGNGMRRPTARRNKFQMQMAIREAGLTSADSFVASSSGDIVSWADDRDEWPVVLKPLMSAGADNVIVCATAEEVAAGAVRIMGGVDRYGRRNDAVLAQEYLAGEEHYVNTVSRDGRHRVVEIWRYYKLTVDGRSVYDYENLLSPDDPTARQIADYTLAVLDALEIRNGAAHTEVMLTKNGPILIECGARLGGGQMPELLSRCIGTNQIDSLALSIARPAEFARDARARCRPVTHLRCVNLISRCQGRMPTAERWNPVRTLSSFAGLALSLPEGSPVSRTVDLATCPGSLYLSSDDFAQVEADYARLRHLEDLGLYN